MPFRPIDLAATAIAVLAVAVPALVVSTVKPHPHRAVPRVMLQRRVVPQAELPPVEPVRLVDLAPDDARAFNDSVPFVEGPNPAARPFRFAGGAEDRARAVDCLAAAVVYEAGDDALGEQAVAQVILNRLRHPAFPKTVCGVVFQGAERTTGCQFTFSCDGALTRWSPSDAAWRRARDVAAAALSGNVYKPVGYATHYHTDWVVPYWQASLDKLAAVHTHLFFRWSGWWGTPPAFNRHPDPIEPTIGQLAAFSDAHRTGAALDEVRAAFAEAAALFPTVPGSDTSTAIAATVPDAPVTGPDTFLVTLDARQPPESYAQVALKTCGERPRCKLLGWVSQRAVPASADAMTPAQMAIMSFSYLRDRPAGFERTLWNCRQFKQIDRRQCMKEAVTPVPAATPAPSGPAELDGIRRRSAAPPSATRPGTSPATTP